MIQHVHGGGEENALIGLASTPGNDFCQKCFSDAGIANKDGAGSLGQELQIEQAQDPILQLHATLVMFEVKAVNRMLRGKARTTETALNGAPVARFQFHVG